MSRELPVPKSAYRGSLELDAMRHNVVLRAVDFPSDPEVAVIPCTVSSLQS